MGYRTTDFGICERLMDHYKYLAIGLGIVTVTVLCVVKPQLWYLWIFAGGFVAWAAPIAIILPLWLLESVVWRIVHPKTTVKRWAKGMGKITSKREWLICGILALLFIARNYKISELKEQIKDIETEVENLKIEADDIEEDFYFAFSALQQIDSLLSINEIDSAKNITKASLSDLGNIRFYQENNEATDILTFRTVDTDTTWLNFSRKMRYMDYPAKRDTFIKIMGKSKAKSSY